MCPNCEKESVVDAFWLPCCEKSHQQVGTSLFAAHGPFGHIRGPLVPLFLYQMYKLCCLHSADNNVSPVVLQELSRLRARPVK